MKPPAFLSRDKETQNLKYVISNDDVGAISITMSIVNLTEKTTCL